MPSRAQRLPLFLALLLLPVALLLANSFALRWTLESDFDHYAANAELARLDWLVARLEAEYASRGNWNGLRLAPERRWRELTGSVPASETPLTARPAADVSPAPQPPADSSPAPAASPPAAPVAGVSPTTAITAAAPAVAPPRPAMAAPPPPAFAGLSPNSSTAPPAAPSKPQLQAPAPATMPPGLARPAPPVTPDPPARPVLARPIEPLPPVQPGMPVVPPSPTGETNESDSQLPEAVANDVRRILARLTVLDANGQALAGKLAAGPFSARRPLQHEEKVIGQLALQAAAPDAAGMTFLATQARRHALVLALALLLAIPLAWLLAGRLSGTDRTA